MSAEPLFFLIPKGDEWLVGSLPLFSARWISFKAGDDLDEEVKLVTTLERFGKSFPDFDQAVSYIRRAEAGRQAIVSSRDMRMLVEKGLQDSIEQHSDSGARPESENG